MDNNMQEETAGLLPICVEDFAAAINTLIGVFMTTCYRM